MRHTRLTRLGMATLAGAIALVIASCASAVPHVVESDMPIARQHGYDDATQHQLASGRELYIQNCAGCHTLFTPADYAPEAWPGIVTEMRDKVAIDDRQADAITRYLVVVSARDDGR